MFMRKKLLILMFLIIGNLLALTGKVEWSELNFRNAPSKSSTIIEKYHKGKYFQILDYQGEWVRANANGKTGYFYKQGVSTSKTIGTYLVKSQYVDFRWGPSQRYNLISRSDGNIAVEVLWKQGEYYFGQYNGSGVWFHRTALADSKQIDVNTTYSSNNFSNNYSSNSENTLPPEVDDEDSYQTRVRVYNPKKKGSSRSKGMSTRRASYDLGLFYNQGGVESFLKDNRDVYTQELMGGGLYFGFKYGILNDNSLQGGIRLKSSYTPKFYNTSAHSYSYEIEEHLILSDLSLGLHYNLGYYVTFSGGAGLAGIYHIIDYKDISFDEESDKENALNKLYLGFSSYFDMSFGFHKYRLVVGAEYYRWKTDDSRFFITYDGLITPTGKEYTRDTIRGYAGFLFIF